MECIYTYRAEGSRTILFNDCGAFGRVEGTTLHRATTFIGSQDLNWRGRQLVGELVLRESPKAGSSLWLVGAVDLFELVGIESPMELVGTESPLELVGTKSSLELVETESPLELVGTQSLLKLVGIESPLELVGTQSLLKLVGTESSLEVVAREEHFCIPTEYELHVPLLEQCPYDTFPNDFRLSTNALEAVLWFLLHPVIKACLDGWQNLPS
ncbi:hypothetical protein BHE74_00003640 [Ensete ventricosum]|nr:hypothetical protein BHE74_00003640 [Ensete ventricosum]